MAAQSPVRTADVGPPGDDHSKAMSAHLETAVRRFQSPLIHYVEQILPDRPHQAQDVVQMTFLQFRKALMNGTPIAHDASWLYRVAHNLAIDVGRRESRHTSFEAGLEDQDGGGGLRRGEAVLAAAGTDPGPDERLGDREECDLALRELQLLPAEDKQVLLLKLFANMTLEQIATVTGSNTGTLHYRLNRGLRTLNRRFRELGVIGTGGVSAPARRDRP